MKTVTTVEEIVKETTLLLSNVFLSKINQQEGEFLTKKEVFDLYVEALKDTAKVFQTEHNNSSSKLQ